MHILQSFRKILTTRYARELEAELERERGENARKSAEISRLRAENRALLNSILGIAGIPPVLVSEPMPSSDAALAAEASSEAPASGNGDNESACRQGPASSAHRDVKHNGKSNAIAPLRRRSWHQVMRGLELASARKPQERELP
jgi:hypothetical protein